MTIPDSTRNGRPIALFLQRSTSPDYDTSGRWPRMVKRWHNLQGITLITTMNSAGWVYRLIFGNAIKKALFTGTFWKMGYRNRKWINFSMVKFVSEEKRKTWLEQLDKRFSRLTPTRKPATPDTNCTTTGQPAIITKA